VNFGECIYILYIRVSRNALTWTLSECGYTRAKLRCKKCGAYTERRTPPLAEEETPFKKNINGLGTNVNYVNGPDEAQNQE
jgi:hypothetical protein